MKRDRCWARKLDDCCSKLSGEHVIAVNAWPGENREEKARTKIRFQRGNLLANGSLDTSAPGGFSREHTVNSATRNVLCVDHNSRLSVVDDEAGVLTDAMLGYWQTRQKRTVPGLPYARKEFHVDGPRLERWFIKSVIAYAIDDGLPIGSPEVGPGMPTDELVDIAYGLAKPSGFIGLFGAPILNEPMNETNEYAYSFMTWHWRNDGDEARPFVAGAVCFYRGLRFVLNLARDVRVPLGNLRKTLPGWRKMEVLQPLRHVHTPSSNVSIFFDWPPDRCEPITYTPPGEITEAA